jgi:uncharacterized peroxidase-related enzyme
MPSREPFIPAPNGLPGMAGLLSIKPASGRMLNELAQQLLRGESPLSEAERELIGAHVSRGNECQFCARTHEAVATALRGDDGGAPVSAKMSALLHIADKVRSSGLDVTPDDVAQARAAGASDEDIHDTVLIAAAFCMFNRYVDGLAAVTPRDDEVYAGLGRMLATRGYVQ